MKSLLNQPMVKIKANQGFALLMSLIVVSVVVSIALTLLDLTIKQLRLSTNSKDSEIAFHAASAGLECSRYWRRAENSDIETGATITPDCFGVEIGSTPAAIVPASNGDAYHYEFETTWGETGSIRCSQINMLVLVSPIEATTTVSGVKSFIPGYPNSNTKECGPGGRCTIISSRGYNKACNDIGLTGTLQREVLLEL